MTVDKDGPPGNSFEQSIDAFKEAVLAPENRARAKEDALNLWDKFKNVSLTMGKSVADGTTQYLKGEENPDFKGVTEPVKNAFHSVTNLFSSDSQDTASKEKPGDTTTPSSTGKPADGKTAADPKAAPEEESMHWIANLMFTFMPKGVKDWAATAAIPLVTQGQALMAGKNPPRVVDGMGAYMNCLQGDITVIPKAVQDYGLKLLEGLGLGRNEELATALSVGFISFVRTQIANLFPALGIKGFKEVAQTPAPSPAQLLGFAHNPQTFIGLFNLAPKDSKVDDSLLKAFKEHMTTVHKIDNIDQFFIDEDKNPLTKVTYGQFVHSYARLGQEMLAQKKWNLNGADSALVNSANDLLNNYGISGPLAQGFAAASLQSADMIAKLTNKAPEPPLASTNTGPKAPGT